MRWIFHLHQDFADHLSGAPDFLLSVALLIAAALLALAAFRAPVTLKPALIAWIVLP